MQPGSCSQQHVLAIRIKSDPADTRVQPSQLTTLGIWTETDDKGTIQTRSGDDFCTVAIYSLKGGKPAPLAHATNHQKVLEKVLVLETRVENPSQEAPPGLRPWCPDCFAVSIAAGRGKCLKTEKMRGLKVSRDDRRTVGVTKRKTVQSLDTWSLL